jgi:hypothetical protein
MNQNTQPIRREIGNELASQWLKLSAEVRQGVKHLKLHSSGTNLESPTLKLHQDTLLLCDHFDKLHNDVQAFLAVLDQENLSTDISSLVPSKMNSESSEQSIKVQEKEHEQSDSLKDVIKALFMWRDNDTESKNS